MALVLLLVQAASALLRSGVPRRAPVALSCADVAGFGPLQCGPALAERLAAQGFTEPMPIQRAAMPLIAAGENVVLHAATGSGKTLAFLVPLIDALGELPRTNRKLTDIAQAILEAVTAMLKAKKVPALVSSASPCHPRPSPE